jgi:hypothetical protein
MSSRRLAMGVSALLVAGSALLWVWSRSETEDPAQRMAQALEACIRTYSADAGRRDAAEALRAGDSRLLYRVEFFQEGSEAHVPGIETVGVSGEGWTPPKDLAELVGRFEGDRNWYWVSVRSAKTPMPKPKPWYLPDAQDNPRLAKCRKANHAYLEAYNRSIPLEQVPRRPAPTPNPRFAVAGGRPPIDAASDVRP